MPKKRKARKEIHEWHEKELPVKDMDEFVAFAEHQGWSEDCSGNVMMLSGNGRRLYFEIKVKWVRVSRSAFPLVRAFYLEKNMKK